MRERLQHELNSCFSASSTQFSVRLFERRNTSIREWRTPEKYVTAPHLCRSAKCTRYVSKSTYAAARHILLRTCITCIQCSLSFALCAFSASWCLLIFASLFQGCCSSVSYSARPLCSSTFVHRQQCLSQLSSMRLRGLLSTVVDAMRFVSFCLHPCNATFDSVWSYKIYSIQWVVVSLCSVVDPSARIARVDFFFKTFWSIHFRYTILNCQNKNIHRFSPNAMPNDQFECIEKKFKKF